MLSPEAKAALQAIDESAERIRKMNQETISMYQRSPAADKPSVTNPVVSVPQEYVPPTPAELYAACQTKNEIWKKHMEEVKKLYAK